MEGVEVNPIPEASGWRQQCCQGEGLCAGGGSLRWGRVSPTCCPVFPPWMPSHHTATFAATCVHHRVCLLNGRKSDEPIVGRSVCCLGRSDGDRMSQSTFPTSASCAFVCCWNSEGDQLEQTSQHMAAAAFLFFFLLTYLLIH